MKVGILYLNGFIEDRILSTHSFRLLAQSVRAVDYIFLDKPQYNYEQDRFG